MPLMSGNSKEAMSKNIKMEMEHGKPHDQAVAIAMSKAGKSKKSKTRNRKANYSHEAVKKAMMMPEKEMMMKGGMK